MIPAAIRAAVEPTLAINQSGFSTDDYGVRPPGRTYPWRVAPES